MDLANLTVGTHTYSLTATNDAGSDTKTFRYTVYEIPDSATLEITSPTILPDATVGEPYSFQFTSNASGYGVQWDIHNPGALPDGISINEDTGVFSGTPTQAGTYVNTIRARATSALSGNLAASKDITITVLPASTSGDDEPTTPTSVLVQAGAGGSINSTTYAVSANENYVIDQLFVDGTEIIAASGQTSHTPSPLPTKSIFATFRAAATVLVQAGAGSSINGTTYAVSANENYVIDQLFVDGTEITAASGEESHTPSPLPTVSIFATFRAASAAVLVQAGAGGSINGTTYAVSANENYEISQLFIDGAEDSAASGQTSYTPTTAPTKSIFAIFARISASPTVLVQAGHGGSINGTSYEVTASSGYVIDQLFIDGAEVSAASGRTSYTPASPPTASIIATFAYQVNFNTPDNGTLTVARANGNLSSGAIVRGGDVLTITATANENYVLSSLTVNGTPLTLNTSGIYTYTVGSSGAKRTAGSQNVLGQGADIVATFSEDASAFIAVTEITRGFAGSVATNTELPLSGTVLPLDASNQTIVWSVSVSDDGSTGAIVLPGDKFTAVRPGTATVTATVIDGTAAGTPYTQEFTITVTDTPVTTYTVTVTNGTGGGAYAEGDPVTIVAGAPEANKRFKEWTISPDVTFTTGDKTASTATFTMPGADVTATAGFEAIPPTQRTVTVSASPTAGGAVSGGGTYDDGHSLTVTATANADYRFVKWTENGGQVSADASYTFPVTADRTLVAVFEESVNPPAPDAAPTVDPPDVPPGRTITVMAGSRATMSVTATGTETLTYQWYKSMNGGAFSPIEDETGRSYTTSPVKLSNDGYRYYCVVTNDLGRAQSCTFILHVTERVDIPTTGDRAMPGLWIGMMLLAGAGLAASLALRRRRRA